MSHERGHTGQSRVTESTCTAGHHTVAGKEIRKSQESCTVPVYVLSVNTLPRAHARLSLNTSIRNKLVSASSPDKHSTSFSSCPHAQSCHSSSYCHTSCTGSQKRIPSAPRREHFISLSSADSSSGSCRSPRIRSPMMLMSCSIFCFVSGFVIRSAGFTFVPIFFVTNLFELDASCIHRLCMSTCVALLRPLRLTRLRHPDANSVGTLSPSPSRRSGFPGLLIQV